jgi:hypothetical protein
MPDGTPLTPEQQAQAKMAEWMATHSTTTDTPGPFGGLFDIAKDLMAAVGAGQLAIAPDTGAAINKQLTAVQDIAEEIMRGTHQLVDEAPFGGGFAEEISRFNQQLAAGSTNSAKDVMNQFSQELEVLKQAVTASAANYSHTDDGGADNLNTAGGDL